jgi:LDH2 family malate/lactate/ureidoglycolate dehydrogenase
MPGEQSHGKRAVAAKEGIAVAPALRKALDTLADELGITRLE